MIFHVINRVARRARLLGQDFVMFQLMIVLGLVVFVVVLPMRFLDKAIRTNLHRQLVAVLVYLAG